MATYTFPADGFVVRGDPEAVRRLGGQRGRPVPRPGGRDAWETAFLASLAESSTPGQPDHDSAASRAFWRWYLLEAIPSVDAG